MQYIAVYAASCNPAIMLGLGVCGNPLASFESDGKSSASIGFFKSNGKSSASLADDLPSDSKKPKDYANPLYLSLPASKRLYYLAYVSLSSHAPYWFHKSSRSTQDHGLCF